MLKTLGFASKVSINFLKAMLIILAVSFFLRAVFLALVIWIYELINDGVWTPACTWLTTSYLLFGEIIPIGFVFWYHIYSGPQIKKSDEIVEEQRRVEIATSLYSRKTTNLTSPEQYMEDNNRYTRAAT